MAPPICPSCSGSQRGTPLCSCKHCRPQPQAGRQNAQKSAPAEGAKTRSCLLPVTSSLWQSKRRGNWVEAPLEGETGALNESHMFPKMEALQAAWAHSTGRSGAPRAAPQHSSPTHGCAPSTRFHLAPPWRHEAQFTFAAERECAGDSHKTK